MVAFIIRGLGRYEKIRNAVILNASAQALGAVY